MIFLGSPPVMRDEIDETAAGNADIDDRRLATTDARIAQDQVERHAAILQGD